MDEKEKKKMNMPQPVAQEVNLQEHTFETPADHSLPAAQVIEEQNDTAELNSAPRFIP